MSLLKIPVTVLLTLSLTSVTEVVSSDASSGLPHVSNFLLSTSRELCGTEEGRFCADCNSFYACVRQGNDALFELPVVNCEEANPKRPYCKDGFCSTTKSSQCLRGPCTSNGYFPDPYNCTKYFICEDLEARDGECPDGFVYNHDISGCSRQNSTHDCVKIKCPHGPEFHYVAYPKDHNVYAVCGEDIPTILFKCNSNEVFNEKTNKCQFDCPHEGNFAYGGDEQKYIQCRYLFLGRGKYQVTVLDCPTGTTFNSSGGRCTEI